MGTRGAGSVARRALALALLCAGPCAAQAAEGDQPPEPEVVVPLVVPEAELDALAAGDPRRADLLVKLAVRRHADAVEMARAEAQAHELALREWRAENEAVVPPVRRPPPARATPRADALRAQSVTFTQRALAESPEAAGLPPALLVGGIDADRIGRPRDALKMLAFLIRRFPEDRHVPDAWLAIGEHHLRRGDLTRARVAFEVAQRRGTTAVRAWAAGRLGEMGQRAANGLLRPDSPAASHAH